MPKANQPNPRIVFPATPINARTPAQPPRKPPKKKQNCAGFCGVLAVIACIGLIALIASAFGSHSSAAPTADDINATATAQAQFTSDASALLTQDTPTDQPTDTPTPKPQSTRQPTHQATAKSTPRPACQAVNGNPWCYNFSPGNLITNPPGDFCSYFNCIASFVSADDPDGGYVVECQDTTFSQSGGESGACSHHGGELRPLYSH